MKKLLQLFPLFVFIISCRQAGKTIPDGWWRVSLVRDDSVTIDFNFEAVTTNGQQVWYIRNADERLEVTDIQQKGDSVIVTMPLFESVFYLQLQPDETLQGKWVKGTSRTEQVMPVVAFHNQLIRYAAGTQQPATNISGRWAVTFNRDDRSRPAVAEFTQTGHRLYGTMLTPTGDYRYLEGVVAGDSLQLSTFDGNHAYYFKATIDNDSTLSNGLYYSGATFSERWAAVKDSTATVPDSTAAVYVKEGQDKLDFTFPDLDSNLVSINDERFNNKVVIIQIMGSWCPNCMDETAFLSDFYEKNKDRGIEMIALAYEYSTDFQRSQKSLRKFQQRFNISYPMLITGVRTGDTLRTEKTLPQLTPIRMFPTTIFVGRDGKVKKIHTGFTGPGTGEHYEQFKKEFNAIINELVKQ